MAGSTLSFYESRKNSCVMGFAEDKNYHFKEDKAYTEDDMLVYNIFVYKIPKKATYEETLKYFSQFGEVKKVRLVADKKRSRKSAPKVGFINFADPISAAKVLKQNTPHIIQSKKVCVKACDSWHQPEARIDNSSTIANQSMDTDENGASTNSTLQPSLLMLNDDCLEHIFKKLELKEQVRFSRACQRFRDVFEMVCKTEYKTHVVENLAPLTLWETREFFKTAGPSIEELIGSVPYKDRERIVEFISNFCPNIKVINFNTSRLKSAVLKKLLDKLTNVTVLKLADCSLNDNAILALKKLPKLESLMVSKNYELTGKYMDRLKNVKELILYGCGNIQPTHFIDVCKSLKDLQTLDIQRCERLSANAYCEMVTYCINLESLKIQSWNPVIQYECVARLPRLKNLEVLSSSPAIVRLELFNELAEHKASQLEYLKIVGKNCINNDRAKQIGRLTSLKQLICSNNEALTDDGLRKFCDLQNLEEIVLSKCRSITNDGLLALLRRCTKLKKVNIQSCQHITDQFVLKAIELFKSTQNQRSKEPCVFYVFKTGINSYMSINSEYLAANALIKLSFHFPPNLGHDGEESVENSDFSDEDDFDDNFLSDELDEDNYDDPYDMFGAFSDQDDIDDDVIHNAYDMFGRYANYGNDINDFMW